MVSSMQDKMRQHMYLHHLRQVEIIANRDPSLFTNNRTIVQLHRRNKLHSTSQKLR